MIAAYPDIKTTSDRIRGRKLSPVEITEACLDRIERDNPTVNAFITVLKDSALRQAQAAEADLRAGKWRGPLHGIPVGIKDFYDTAGIRTTAAFEQFKDRVPARDAVSVARLKAAGAIIVGKTNMHTLGMGTTGLVSYFGPVRNPLNVDYIPGGSSAGSAAAVASGMCFATLDTDAVGSCRLPAACCGVVGFKGTYGLIETKGILEGEQAPDPFIVWMAHAAVTTRSVEDTAMMLDVLAQQTIDFGAELSEANKELRLGVASNVRADPDVSQAFEAAVESIRELGCSTRRVAVPLRDPGQGVGSIEADRKTIAGRVFKDVDVIVLPTTPTTVPTVGKAGDDPQALSPENTAFANYYGLPAISVPCGFDKNGLPLGVQIVGKPWDEESVLQLAHQYQRDRSLH